ncbi:hypothetical protein [Actinoplanes sp. NBRC 103695]|uniref:hypothetical protein n=1 Tax=Actinoplanes sp. NBRC 103695 TaxID=3032202 RepID=UPI0025528453|nr:hypothetical protein [Actinoplanes sp. NBRC 103695]
MERSLGATPALASWDKAGSPGQLRSAAFVAEAYAVLADTLRTTPDPLALQLNVGLSNAVPLLAFHDLDNYLFPLVPKLVKSTGRTFASVWARKQHSARSSVAVCQTHAIDDPGGTYSFDVATTASTDSAVYKQQIRDQTSTNQPLPAGAVALQLAFVVGPRRAWPNLWKPTIDALGTILGRDADAREWNVRDGRITDLGLHCVVEADAGKHIAIAVRAQLSELG